VIAILLAAAAIGGAGAPAAARRAPVPREVRSLVDRRVGCNHWGGEDPYDQERAKEINSVMRSLRCVTLDRDEARLKRRYAGRSDVLRLLRRADHSEGVLDPE
jgi:hypothetical protein